MKTVNPIGIETQIDSVLFGESQQEQESTTEKISFAKENINSIVSINGMKVKKVEIEGNNIYYNNNYYYPIKYARIVYNLNN
jgi:hypothetical protein